jgi:magnesium transporter
MEELDRQEILDDVSYLIEAKQAPKLRAIMLDAYPADIADLLSHMDDEHRNYLFAALDPSITADVILEVDESTRQELIEGWDESRLAALVREMNSDDAADFIIELAPELAAKVLKLIEPEESAEVRQLLAHEEDTAGGIMALELVAMPQDGTVEEAINEIRKKADEIETINHVYVTDENRRLVGIVPLKKLLLAEAYTPLSAIMNRDVISVLVGTDQEEVAKLARKYDLLSVPVVDAQGRLVGRITYDDIVDVMQEEVAEDISHMAGIASHGHIRDAHESSVLRTARLRLPWLVIGLFGGIVAAWILSFFEGRLQQNIVVLMFFVPVVMAMGGNAGIQSSTIVVHGLATGNIGLGDMFQRLLKEMRVAFLNGFLCGLLLLLIVTIGWREPHFGALVGASLLIVMFVAAVVGATVPLLLKRFDVDPAIATGPFITISNDILGLFIYMGISTMYFLYLQP